MATVPNLPLSLAQVRAVFGAPAGTPLHNFHRGGPWVPNIAANNNVPTSGPIRLAQLVGATNYQPIALSGPSSRNMGNVYNQRPPDVTTVSAGVTLTGGNGSVTASWTYISGVGRISCLSPSTVNATFQAYSDIIDDGDVGTFSAVWRLQVSDGITSATKDVTFTVTLVNP